MLITACNEMIVNFHFECMYMFQLSLRPSKPASEHTGFFSNYSTS